jgi:hypothetical protein
MTIDTTKLRALAEAATPGPYWANIHACVFQEPGTEAEVAECLRDEDALYIAAVHPQTVLALIGGYEEAERLQPTQSEADELSRFIDWAMSFAGAAQKICQVWRQQGYAYVARKDGEWLPFREVVRQKDGVEPGTCYCIGDAKFTLVFMEYLARKKDNNARY